MVRRKNKHAKIKFCLHDKRFQSIEELEQKNVKKVGNTVKFNSLTRHTMYEIPILTHQSSFSTPF